MAHEITASDSLLLIGKPAWHGLGTVLPEQIIEPREALKLAGLDWRVRGAPLVTATNVRYLHTSGLARRLDSAKASLEQAEAMVSVQRAESELLFATQWDIDTLSLFLSSTVSEIRNTPIAVRIDDTIQVSSEHEQNPLAIKRAVELTDALVTAMRHDENMLEGMQGTAWQAYQGVSRWAQHERKGRMDPVTSELAGPVRMVKARAWSRALELCR